MSSASLPDKTSQKPLLPAGIKPYYEHNGIVIFHGDCREILPNLGRFDLALTDPPYGIGFAAQPTKWQRKAGQKPENWDNLTVDEVPYIIGSARIQIVWGGNYYPLPTSRGWLAWCKPDAPPSMGTIEFAWTNQNRNSKHLIHSISATNPERLGHPTQKPLAVMRWCIGQFPDVGSVVDPFAGSGTTLEAAKAFGLSAVGIEINERYCEIAAKRLQQEVMDFGDVA